MSSHQPVCESRWRQLCMDWHGEYIDPKRIRTGDFLQCCYCGEYTDSGIFVRVDPNTVSFPSNVD